MLAESISVYQPPAMKVEKAQSSRRPRSDGRRNREAIVQAAKEAFTENGAGTSLDDIAKKAGVGPGTLYRHFPSREALLGAVYQAEVEKLAESAEQLGRELPAGEALRAFLHLFIEHLATKRIIAAALNDLVSSNRIFEPHMSKMHTAVAGIYARAIEAGEIRPDINPVDHIRAIVGVTFFGTSEDWRDSATRLLDILILGSRPPKSSTD